MIAIITSTEAIVGHRMSCGYEISENREFCCGIVKIVSKGSLLRYEFEFKLDHGKPTYRIVFSSIEEKEDEDNLIRFCARLERIITARAKKLSRNRAGMTELGKAVLSLHEKMNKVLSANRLVSLPAY